MKTKNLLILLVLGAVSIAVAAAAFARGKGMSVFELAELGAGVVGSRVRAMTGAIRRGAPAADLV